jgi:hypothetical protein
MGLLGKTLWRKEETAPPFEAAELKPIAGGTYPPPEHITTLITKVYDECSICECPTEVVTVPSGLPPISSIIDCTVTNIVTVSSSIKINPSNPSKSKVTVTIQFTVTIDYSDASGATHTISEDFFLTKTVLLYALDGMQVVVFSLGQCLDAIKAPDGLSASTSIGLYLVIKTTHDIQFVLTGHEPGPPPACHEVGPISCDHFLNQCSAGGFWPPWPPQPPA